jgi:hypothetical protein
MGRHGHERAALRRAHVRPDVAERVAVDGRDGRESAADDLLDRRLEAGRTRRETEVPQQVDAIVHVISGLRHIVDAV